MRCVYVIYNINIALNTGDQQDPQEFNKLFMDQLERIEMQSVHDGSGNNHNSCSPNTISSYTAGLYLQNINVCLERYYIIYV